ncbi:hypothetical protein F52700_7468 [Fusarium sp. NRRL 52700]|nr:hypothetical protein F52700_7468 [Fusarium sp. NRRL 52700]
MPTATAYSGIGLINNGPLTTTYTPPASCITATTDQIFFAHPESITIGYGAPTCETTSMGKCLPSGSNHDKLFSYLNDHGGESTIDYYSPGIACPEGWTTAGTLAHGNQSGSVEKSGVFTQTTIVPPGVSVVNPTMLVERVCPNSLLTMSRSNFTSGWFAAKGGNCYSSIKPLRSATYTEVCNKPIGPYAKRSVYTVESSKVSEYSVVTAEPNPKIWPMTVVQTQAYFQYAELAVVRRFPAVKLVYRESDLKPTGGEDESKNGESSDDDKNDGAEGKDDDNGASSLLRGGGIFSIVAVLLSMLIGAGLVMF